jgi:membrane protein DedA with SNARE-associated domain
VSHFITEHGLPLLFLVVLAESFGVPVPGETALIAFGVLASQGHYAIWEVIVVAAVAAIIGDNLGYWVIGRWGGRRLLGRWGWLRRYSDRVLPRAERVMARHGGKTVFIGRFVSVLRYTVAWIAGITHMGRGGSWRGTPPAASPGPPPWAWSRTTGARRSPRRSPATASTSPAA